VKHLSPEQIFAQSRRAARKINHFRSAALGDRVVLNIVEALILYRNAVLLELGVANSAKMQIDI